MTINTLSSTEKNQDRIDKLLRYIAIVSGITSGVLFLFSLVALIEFPGLFKWSALLMILTGIAFFLLRSLFKYRNTFRVKDRK
jgi:uncharacterized membrane protein (DUF2068 family)